MAKHRPRRLPNGFTAPKRFMAGNFADSDPEASRLDVTLSPLQPNLTTTQTWMGPNSTVAPKIGEADQEDKYSPKEWPSFVEKLLKGQIDINLRSIISLVTLIWFGVLSWLFIKDNDIGRLNVAEGIKWFFVKSSFYSILFTIAMIMIIVLYFRKKPKKG